MAENIQRNCELCSGEASVYCSSDSAYLCYTCDVKVHGANFLVARHVRSSICRGCHHLAGNHFSGAGMSPAATVLCRSCSPEKESFSVEDDDDDDSLSSSSSCVSSTTETGDEALSRRSEKSIRAVKKGGRVAVDYRVEGVLVNWCRRGGVEDKKARQVVHTAVEMLGGFLERMTVLPFRVSLAAAFWVALRLHSGGDKCQDLRRVEQISGVPAKLILATETRLLARVIKRRPSRESHEEGWAEC